MIDKIAWPKYCLDMTSLYTEVMTSKLALRCYDWQLITPAISRGNRQPRGGSRYLAVMASHLFYWFRLSIRGFAFAGHIHFQRG